MTRLEAICSLIEQSESFADVGCDHGYIAEYVLKNGLAKTVYASDVSAKCLSKARELLKDYDNAVCLVSDGLSEYDVEPEQIAICGMGGYAIIGIVDRLKTKPALILQPQNDEYEVRRFLNEKGYAVKREIFAREGDRFYVVISAKAGEQKLDECQLSVGAYYKERDEVLYERLKYLEKKLSSYKLTEKNAALKACVEEALKWQK